jgi:uncharacterized protein (PEP-CTERM system associated)
MHRNHRPRGARPLACTAGALALGATLMGDFARAAEPDAEAAAPVQTARPPRPLTLQPSVGLQETVTDNVALTPADRVSDLVTRLLVALDASLDTGRAKGQLNAEAGYDAYARQSFRSGWSAGGDASASYALIPDRLAIKGEGAVTNGAISTFGVTATDRHGAPGRVQLTTYDVGPELTARIGGRVDLAAAARFGQVLYSNASSGALDLPRDDSMVQLTAAASTDASRPLQLQTSGEYLRDDLDFTSTSGVQSAFLRVSPALRLLGRLGYDHISQAAVVHISAPLASGGLEYRPNTRSVITVEAGRRYHRPAWAADASVEISPRLVMAASYAEEVQPDQVGVARSFRAFAEAGQNLPAPLVPRNFILVNDLYNATSLYRSAILRALYAGPVNQVGLTADWTDRRFLTVGGRDRTLLLDGVVSRRLRPALTLLLRANYARTYESPRFGATRAFGGSAQLAWRVNSHTDFTANLSRTDNRQLFAGGQKVTENAVFLALRRSF